MNLFRYFESRANKGRRAHTDALKQLVEEKKREQLEAEEALRRKMARTKEMLARPPFARALGRWESQND